MHVSRDNVVGFRLAAHGLGERIELDRRAQPGGLLMAAGRCGVQDSPPGSALLALNARVHGLTAQLVDDALGTEKSLLHTWSLRGAPFLFPTTDAPVFTTGVLPVTEKGLRHFLPGVVPAVEQLGMAITDAVDLTRRALVEVLSGRQLAIGELGAAIAQRISLMLAQQQRIIWDAPGPYAPGQPLGEAVVHFCLRVLTLQATVCFAPRRANTAPFVLVNEWLGHPVPTMDPALARAELLRRYLRCYGPSTPGHFATWLGVAATDAALWWGPTTNGPAASGPAAGGSTSNGLTAGELTQVEYRGATSWILTEDADALRSAPRPTGVRLLPPHDPYTQLRDRGTIIDAAHHRSVWRPVGDPGTVLVNGEIAGTWRPRKHGQVLTITFEWFDEPPGITRAPHRDNGLRRELQREAEHVATLRGAASVQVQFGAI